jgi:hypothetical protein
MASTYTTDLAIQLMATGENAGTWGAITNTNLVVIQQAIAGYESISIAGGAQTTALVMTQNALANARNAVIKLTGTITGNQVVTIPNGIEKTWIISNGTTGAFTVQFKYASTGTGQTWSTTDKGIKILYADGSDIQVVDLSTLSGTVATAQIANFAVTTAKLDTNAVTAVKITQSTITQAKLAANSVGANQIVQSTITQAKLAANSVGSNQLISTGVVAGSYTVTSLTVDADGRITSASSGVAGGGLGGTTVFTSPGTFTIPSGKTVIKATLIGAGGGRNDIGSPPADCSIGNAGGGGGTAIKYYTGLTAGNTIAVTVGQGVFNATGGTSSISSGTQTITTTSATGGQANGSSGGAGSGGDINFNGGSPINGFFIGGPNNPVPSYAGTTLLSPFQGSGGPGGGAQGAINCFRAPNTPGAAGVNGIVIFEY